MKKTTLKSFIWDELDKKGYVLDRDIAKFRDKVNWGTVEEYKRRHNTLNREIYDYGELEDDINTMIERKGYLLTNEKILGKDKAIKISKDYFDYLKERGVKVKTQSA